MKKYVSLTLILTSVLFLTGCQGKTVEDEMSIDTDKALEEIAALTNGEIAPASVGQSAATAALPVAGTMPAVDVSMATGSFEKPTTELIQQALANAGLYTGKVDGDLGPKTKRAIREFQEQNGLNADGKVGPKTWQKMVPYLNPAPVATSVSGVTN